jgi:trigger factor
VAEVSEADVDKAVDRLARSSRELVSKAEGEAAVAGDVVVIDFLGTLDGVAFEGGKGTDFDLELGSGQFIPGFEDQLIGAKAGESRDVNVTFPEGYGAENLAGKAAVFAVTVKDVKEAKATTRDDEFAKKFGFDTYEALREAARGQVAQEYKRASRARIKRALLDALDKKFDFAVPPSMVEGEIDAIMRQLSGDEEGGTAPQIEDSEKAEFRRIAERRVRLGLLLAEVGRLNNVSVAQEDLNRAIVDQARRYPGQERQVFDFYNKNPEAVAELRAPLFEEKVVDFVLELAKVTDRSVSVDELMRDPEAEDA